MGSLESMTFKMIFKFLVKSQLYGGQDNINGERKLSSLKCEIASPDTDWQQTWRRTRLKGLGPELTTFLLKLTWGILPTGTRLAKCRPGSSPDCQLCKTTGIKVKETLLHSFFICKGNKETPGLLIKLLRSYDPEVTPSKLLTLDMKLESHMELPLLWISSYTLSLIWAQRQEGKVCKRQYEHSSRPDATFSMRAKAPPCRIPPLWQINCHPSNVRVNYQEALQLDDR